MIVGMGMVDDLLFEEDAKWHTAIANAIERVRLSRLRRAWTDRHGVTHILIPNVVDTADGPVLGNWRWACGTRCRPYAEHDDDAVPNCIHCVGATDDG